jgi:hypothetical protein
VTRNGSSARADWLRTARLLFDRELCGGALDPAAVDAAAAREVLRVRAVPTRPLRVLEQVRYKLGRLSYEANVVEQMVGARRDALGESAGAPPRFLVRVDEFPHYRALDRPDVVGTDCFSRFHEILAGAGVPYLIAVLPRVSHDPLSPSASGSRALQDDEVAMLERLAGERVSFALHGHDHRTRFSSPRRHSELCGLDEASTEQLIARALEELASHGVNPEVFVPPYNRFDSEQLRVLARHFEVVCGGPESIGLMGFQPTPQWRGEAVYLPAYPPFYGRARDIVGPVASMVERAAGLWVPVVLHWEWEQEAGWHDLERFAEVIAPHAADWSDFLAAVRRSASQSAHGDSAEVAQ